MPVGDIPQWNVVTRTNTGGYTYGWYAYDEANTISPVAWQTMLMPKEAERKEMMTLFRVYLVDAKEMEVVKFQDCVGKDQNDAVMEFEMTSEQKKGKKKGRYAFVVQAIGQFEKYTQKVEVESKDE